jgi:peptidoglycan/xylan/chitin deacetylase (PgdA/CDA1 family)
MMPSQQDFSPRPASTPSRMSQYLTYHEIYRENPNYLYGVSATTFAGHLRFLEQLMSMKRLEDVSNCVTFDDGHVSQYDSGFPALELSSLKGLFFVTAGWTNSRAGYMNWGQLAELSKHGHRIESHGWSHANLTQCSPHELDDELRRSKMTLEDHLGTKVSAISIPGGRWNKRVVRACEEAGYADVFTSDPWVVHKLCGGLSMSGRWMVTRGMGEQEISYLLAGGRATLVRTRARALAKKTARSLLGDHFYHSVWTLLSMKDRSQENHGVAPSSGE